MKCNVVCIQTYPKMNQKEENLFHMETLLRKAMESHPDTQLIIFPELAVTGYQCGKNFKDLAETATNKNAVYFLFYLFFHNIFYKFI